MMFSSFLFSITWTLVLYQKSLACISRAVLPPNGSNLRWNACPNRVARMCVLDARRRSCSHLLDPHTIRPRGGAGSAAVILVHLDNVMASLLR